MNNTILSQKLKSYRKEAHLTQQQVADAVGIKRSAYAYYEIGKSSPKLPVLRRIADLYNVSLDDLIYDHVELKADDMKYDFVEDGGIDESFNKLSELEQNILLKIRLMNSAKRQELIDFINTL